MAHAILTGKSIGVLGAYIGFFFFLSRAYTGPWQGKWDMGLSAREQTLGFGPEFAAQFQADSHPGMSQKRQ